MRELTKKEVQILQRHVKWLDGVAGGERADLQGANLQDANLQDADLRGADLQGANLRHANLQGAGLHGADLQGANLQDANLQGADLHGADLQGACLDLSCWPLWCGSINVKADDRLFAQLLFHLTRLDVSGCSGGVCEAMTHIRSMAAADLFCEYRDDVKPMEAHNDR